MAAAPTTPEMQKARLAFIDTIATAVRDVGAAHGVECEFDAEDAVATSPGGGAAKRWHFNTTVWKAQWDALVREHGDDREEEENKLRQHLVATLKGIMLAGLASRDATKSSGRTSTDPGATSCSCSDAVLLNSCMVVLWNLIAPRWYAGARCAFLQSHVCRQTSSPSFATWSTTACSVKTPVGETGSALAFVTGLCPCVWAHCRTTLSCASTTRDSHA